MRPHTHTQPHRYGKREGGLTFSLNLDFLISELFCILTLCQYFHRKVTFFPQNSECLHKIYTFILSILTVMSEFRLFLGIKTFFLRILMFPSQKMIFILFLQKMFACFFLFFFFFTKNHFFHQEIAKF